MKSYAEAFAAAMLALAASVAGAHAFLDRASPAVGSTVHGSPALVRLWFSQELEPAFSSVKVISADGRQIDRQDKQVDHADAAVMQVSVPQLAPGKYRVVWRALSVDTHVTEGDFTFDVAP